MFETLPKDAREALDWNAEQFGAYYQSLIDAELNTDSVEPWLKNWSQLVRLTAEVSARLAVAVTVDTTDQVAEQRRRNYLENIQPQLSLFTHALNTKLLASGLQPAGFELALKKIQTDADLFREENLPLYTEEAMLGMEFDKLIGAQTVQWDGQELTLAQLRPVFHHPDRARREQAWRLSMERTLQDRAALNTLWVRFLEVRRKIAANADMPDFRAYQWRVLKRFDYSPADSQSFQNVIEEVVVPAARRLYERQRTRLGVESLRPWDIGGDTQGTNVDPTGLPPLKPFEKVEQLEAVSEAIFNRVDPKLGGYFRVMRDEKLLDLGNRKGKAPGGYCTTYYLAERPFIFMNAVGTHDDVQTMLHEGGHAFHAFESSKLPYAQQIDPPMEFAEVASMSMELLAAPYLTLEQGGFYSAEQAARARVEHLESMLRFWPYMAVVDAFQHWVYTHPDAASDPAHCDRAWSDLWDRFIQGVDYTGLETIGETGWHRKLHIFQVPFYYVEYGLAQLGAVQVWANAIQDQPRAVQDYLSALALGGTVGLPQLFAAAGGRFAFDPDTLRQAVDLIESTIDQLRLT
jgi:oligoendopeptidase F